MATTTKASFAADGYAPGAAIWFRVTATTSTLRSASSNPISLYAPVAPSAGHLRLAA